MTPKIKILSFLFAFLLPMVNITAQTIKMEKDGGVYKVPCKVNGLALKFIFDTGASDVSISSTEALFMLKNGYLNEDDLGGSEYYRIANGDIAEGTKVTLRKIEIGDMVLFNVEASIVHSIDAPLLLGQSVMERLGQFTIDSKNGTLVIANEIASEIIEADEEALEDLFNNVAIVNGFCKTKSEFIELINTDSEVFNKCFVYAKNQGYRYGLDDFARLIGRRNIYPSVKIGHQVWMTENLNVDRYRNGEIIPQVQGEEGWEDAAENKQPAWCYYNNDPANGPKYGKLYNGYAVSDPRGLCPAGWHIPSDDEWTMLTNALGGEKEAGNKMKSKSGWSEGGNGTNSSGFSGLPAGYRGIGGIFFTIGGIGIWWSSTENGTNLAWLRDLAYDNGNAYRSNYGKPNGFSVRCLRD